LHTSLVAGDDFHGKRDCPVTHCSGKIFRVTCEHNAPEPTVAALDLTVLEELRGTFGGQSPVVANLYANFLTNAARYIEALRSQANDEQVATLHTLKGSAAMMGAVRISALAMRLHEASLHESGQTSESAIRQLEDELAMFRHALAVHFPE
jgi:HPt (histidine-containing phosphotransfer) domain-containing protein